MMKTEAFLAIAAILCAFAVPVTCVTSPPPIVAVAAQEEIIVPVVDDKPEDIVDEIDQNKDQTVGDAVIDSMQNNSSKIDEGMSEIQRDIEELKKRKKIKKKKTITKKKIKKKVIDK